MTNIFKSIKMNTSLTVIIEKILITKNMAEFDVISGCKTLIS